MKITITLRELSDKYDWDKVCEVLNLNYWCMNEGADPETSYNLTLEQAQEIGISLN